MFRPFTVSGVGIHTGIESTVAIHPSEFGTGIHFHTPKGVIHSCVQNLKDDAKRCTALTQMGASVMTVEHFLAAVAFTDARDLHVHISGEEMPILDGSASIWYRRFIEHGARPQVTLIPIATSGDRTPILIESESSRAEIVPIEKAEDAFIEVTLDMSTIGKPKETHRFHPTTDSFDDIASARTFAFEHEVETLKKTGLAKGGGFHNALILGPDGPKNPDGLRFPNEPARHKILDTMGDLFLLNALPLAQIRIFRPGHHLNHQIVRTIAIRP